MKKRESEKHYTEGAGVRRINSAIVFAKVHIVMCFVQGRCESYFFSLLCYTLYNKLVWESSFSGRRKEKNNACFSFDNSTASTIQGILIRTYPPRLKPLGWCICGCWGACGPGVIPIDRTGELLDEPALNIMRDINKGTS